MGCDYYIQNELVIEYESKAGKRNTIFTDRTTEKGYIFKASDYDSDDDEDTAYNKYKAEIQRRIEDNTYNKMLFENEVWIKESYKKKYEDYILKTFNQIHKIKKVYKRTSAWQIT